MTKKPLFISVEGIDGAGKSTHIDFIGQYLVDHGYKFVKSREPGGTAIGETIRNLLLHQENSIDTNVSSSIENTTELFLMFASRQELISKFIVPNLNNNISVVLDRYIDASIAYQGAGRNLGIQTVIDIAKMLIPQLTPDITFLFDVPVEIAYNRVVSNNNQRDRIERETPEFFVLVQQAYYTIAQNEPQRMKIIDTTKSIEETQATIKQYLEKLLWT